MAALPVRNMDEWLEITQRLDGINPLISMMLEFETRTGLRNCDVAALRFSDVMINGVVRDKFDVIQAKGFKMRTNRSKNPMSRAAARAAAKITIVVNDELKDLIEQIRQINGRHDLMFQSNHHHAKLGRPITLQYVNRQLKKIAIDMKLPYQLSSHTMRKTCAMLMRKAGADVKHVSKRLGHSSVAVTSVYLETFEDESESFLYGISLPQAGEPCV